MSERRTLTIKLKGDDVALVMREDGAIDVHGPPSDSDDAVPGHVAIFLAIAEHLEDEAFCDYMLDYLNREVCSCDSCKAARAHLH